MDESGAVPEAGRGVKRLVFKVLDQTSKGIYLCFAEPSQNDDEAKTQSAIFLKRSKCAVKGAGVLSRICCMPSDWRKRFDG